jgi:hypothetical protein
MTETPIQPVPVVLHNAEALAGVMARQKPRTHIRATFRTFVLTAANPMLPILAEDRSRITTWITAFGNSVVLCDSQSQAQDPDNAIAGAGLFANAPANPQGTLLYVPAGVGFTNPPVPQSVRWTLNTTEVVWAVALAFPAYLAITIENDAKGY